MLWRSKSFNRPTRRAKTVGHDGLLMNEPGRKIKEQYVDTGGFTDHVFAVTALLGFQFIPRHPRSALQAALRLRSCQHSKGAKGPDRRQNPQGHHHRQLARHPAQRRHHRRGRYATQPASAQICSLSPTTHARRSPQRNRTGRADALHHRMGARCRHAAPCPDRPK